jgi:hypothetical protein
MKQKNQACLPARQVLGFTKVLLYLDHQILEGHP